jgi:hypothetical protein
MLEYGNDVHHSKQLVAELGITNNVMWYPQMYRKDIMYLINNVDVCTGEFDKSYLTFGTVVEAMVMSKPVIHYREDNLYESIYPDLYPMLHAREPLEITNAIDFAVRNPDALKEMGQKGNRWIKKYFIDSALLHLQNIIEGK